MNQKSHPTGTRPLSTPGIRPVSFTKTETVADGRSDGRPGGVQKLHDDPRSVGRIAGIDRDSMSDPLTHTVAHANKNGHSVEASERNRILVRGVSEVLSFDETLVRLITTAGVLNLEGRDLRVHTLNTNDGVVFVTGTLDGLLYESDPAEPSSPPQKRRFGKGNDPARRKLGR